MADNIKQHYVPQTLLNNFFENKSIVFVLDKSNNSIFGSNKRDIAEENNFYSISNDLETKNEWDNYYKTIIEPLLGKVIREITYICDSENDVFDSNLKNDIAISMFHQALRGKHTRELTKATYEKESFGLLASVKEIFPKYYQLAENNLKDEYFFKSILMGCCIDEIDNNPIFKEFKKRNYLIYEIIGGSEFLICDDPIVFYDGRNFNIEKFGGGLANPNTHVLFPITKKLAIVSTHRKTEKFRNKRIFYLDCTITREKEKIEIFNYMIYKYAKQYVYSNSKQKLEYYIGK